jgi:hypothetical protein
MIEADAKRQHSRLAALVPEPLRPPPSELLTSPKLQRLRSPPRPPAEWEQRRLGPGDPHARLKGLQTRQRQVSPHKAPQTRSASRYSGTCRTGAALGHRDELLRRGPWGYMRLPTDQYRVRIRGTAPSRAGPSQQSFYSGSWDDVLSVTCVSSVLQLSGPLVVLRQACTVYLPAPCPNLASVAILVAITSNPDCGCSAVARSRALRLTPETGSTIGVRNYRQSILRYGSGLRSP